MFPFARFRIIGKSMEPTLRDGDYVIVMRYLFGKPNAGDIVAAAHGRMVVLKRIRKTENGKYLIAGDNSGSSTFRVSRKEIIGKVVYHAKR